ncbi:hypothetical protein JTB14_031361 [Gonioctena quinquepunctata]|nr:hypothetical protein JTB14_031361 [Gonioctena quinquepunctata]
MYNAVSERTKRIIQMAKTQTTIDEDPNYSPDESDSDSEYEHGVTADNDRENIETGQETANSGSDLREESDSDAGESEPLVDRSGRINPQRNHKVFGTKYLKTEGMRPEYAAALVNQHLTSIQRSMIRTL